ncbi:MAG: DMT family transporter [Rubrobacteraceae bacterium]
MPDEKTTRSAALTELTLIFAAVFWGANYAVTKYTAEFLPPILIVTFRFAVGGALLLAVLRLFEPESRLRRSEVLAMAALGCFGMAAAQTSFTFGVSMTSATNTGLVFATAPIWGLLLGFALGLERPTWTGMAGIFLSISGIVAVFYDGIGDEAASFAGDVLVLVAAAAVGCYTVFSMPMLERHTPLAVATYPTAFGAPFVLIFALPQLPAFDFGGVGPGAWLGVAYSAVLATAFTFAAWQVGISRIGANRVLVYQYLITLTGVASGIIFFDESLGWNKILGGAVILVGIYLARRK